MQSRDGFGKPESIEFLGKMEFGHSVPRSSVARHHFELAVFQDRMDRIHNREGRTSYGRSVRNVSKGKLEGSPFSGRFDSWGIGHNRSIRHQRFGRGGPNSDPTGNRQWAAYSLPQRKDVLGRGEHIMGRRPSVLPTAPAADGTLAYILTLGSRVYAACVENKGQPFYGWFCR